MKIRLTVSDVLMVIAGAVMALHPLIFKWAEIAVPDDPRDGEEGLHPFSYFTTGGIAWILIVGVGVAAALAAVGAIKQLPSSWTLLLLGGAAIGATLMVIRLVLGAGKEDGTGLELDPSIGMYVATGAAVLSLIGAIIGYLAEDQQSGRTAAGA